MSKKRNPKTSRITLLKKLGKIWVRDPFTHRMLFMPTDHSLTQPPPEPVEAPVDPGPSEVPLSLTNKKK